MTDEKSMTRKGNKVSRYLKWTAGACAAVLILAADAFLLFLAADYIFPFPEASIHRKTAAVISDSQGRPLRFFLPEDNRWRFQAGLEDISPELVEAVIASEDRWFHHHPGVNPFALVRAFYVNLRAGRVVSGASTIPMQIARMAEPKSRNVTSKVKEAFRAFQLKWRYEDDELLEIYLNIAPYGGNIEGVAAASYFYFGKSPRVLSPAEIALLTALPRSPVAYDPTRNPGARSARGTRSFGSSPEAACSQKMTRRDMRRSPFPKGKGSSRSRLPIFPNTSIRRSRVASTQTTLDSSIQRIATEIAARHIDTLKRDGIENLAIVVIDNETRA
ncbi:MAG: transglycosylase domain-containing protein [Thermodesulfobacteriota bacterium]